MRPEADPVRAKVTTSRERQRPKGYLTNYRPRDKTLALLQIVLAILNEYSAYWPLTVRQIFYRLVGAYSFPKTEKFYKNTVCPHVANARRARVIPFGAIRDDGVSLAAGRWFTGSDDFFAHVRGLGERYRRNLMASQPLHIEVWCEAAGMVPQLAAVAGDYTIPVYSSSGFDSLTAKKALADRVSSVSKPTLILHLGDYDASGEAIFTSMGADVQAFVEADRVDARANVDFIRVALGEAQIAEYSLPTSPPKASDSRSRRWQRETCQLEAIPPDVLASILRDQIETHLDLEKLEIDRVIEKEERQRIAYALTSPKK